MNTRKVTVEQGILEGEERAGCVIFRGVPYAKPPVEDLRFKAPRPCEKWEGVRQALEFGPQCPQMDPHEGFYGREFYNDLGYPLPEQSEDCLYLNIWAPAEKKPGGYPVAMWLHGGAFDHGFSSEMEFDGLAYAMRETILVTVNYRVGVFGFMAHEDLRREDVNKSNGNWGILDQIFALRWLRKNISAFGGNPDRITVFGQSAGAMSTQALITSPLTRGMIKSAILQSGGGYNNGLTRERSVEEANATGRQIMKLCGADTLRDLRYMPAEKLVSCLPKLYEEKGGLCFGPVKDGWVLNEGMSDSIEKNDIHDIPYILGCTSEDIAMDGITGRESALYKGNMEFARFRKKTSDENVYLYYFCRQLPGDDAGAFHSSELWYMFGTLDRSWRPMTRQDYRLSGLMLDCWTNFMKTGDPGNGWRPFDEESRFVRTFM